MAAQESFTEKVVVFVKEKYSHAGEKRQAQKKPPNPWIRQPLKSQAAGPGDEGGAEKQSDELRIAGVIEIKGVAGHQQQPGASCLGQQVVYSRNGAKKAQIDQ